MIEKKAKHIEQPADSLRKSVGYFLIKTLSTAWQYAAPPRYDSQDVDAVIYISISKQNQSICLNTLLYGRTANTMQSVVLKSSVTMTVLVQDISP